MLRGSRQCHSDMIEVPFMFYAVGPPIGITIFRTLSRNPKMYNPKNIIKLLG